MIVTFENHQPRIGAGVWVADDATVLGQVELGDETNIWYGSVLRGDIGRITVGRRTNIQDRCVVHVTMDDADTVIGDEVTVGHGAILHGCTIQSRVLVGMGATVMDHAVVSEYCIVGAGAVVTPGTEIPSGHLVTGTPARVVRELTDDERREIDAAAPRYVQLAIRHAEINGR